MNAAEVPVRENCERRILPKAIVCEKTANTKTCRLRKAKAARGNCVQGDDRGEYCHRATVCEKVAKAQVATSNCVHWHNGWKKAREERVLLKHPCAGRLRKSNTARSNRV